MLAQIVGVSQQTLSKYEKGQIVPEPTMQLLLATVLGSTVADLFPTVEAA